MKINDLLAASPFAYHATRVANLEGLIARRKLLSPAAIYRLNGTKAPHVLRRSKSGAVKHVVPLRDGDGVVTLSDHDRLHARNISFEPGWDMARFVELLDALVFFWPGSASGPSRQGLAHRERYNREGQEFAVLRVPLGDVVEMNGEPRVASCNSGAPRPNPVSGKPPRGAGTFVPLAMFPEDRDIVEIVFDGSVHLPTSAQRATSYGGQWVPLFTGD